MPRRVLFVAYAFPPVGGAGVQRTAKFAKYLPECGWAVSVLTAANPSVPLHDASLCRDIPATTIVARARTWEPSYATKSSVAATTTTKGGFSLRSLTRVVARSAANLVLQPDPQILWAPLAIRRGRRLLRQLKHDAIIATGPPFSSFLIGQRLSREFRIPLVLDYRDEWDISNKHWENRGLIAWGRHFQSWLQTSMLKSSQAVLATTKLSAERIAQRAAQVGASPDVRHVYNGYDPDEFPVAAAPLRRSGRFTITYTGTLWNLTSIKPLIVAAEQISNDYPGIARQLEIAVVGRRTDEQAELLDRLAKTQVRLNCQDYLPHEDAIRLMHDSDCLCVLLSDTPDAARVVPAKLFEYMACKRPVLAISPTGEMWDLLRCHPQAMLFKPAETDAIAQALVTMVQNQDQQRDALEQSDTSCFSRPAQAKQLCEILNYTCRKSQQPYG